MITEGIKLGYSLANLDRKRRFEDYLDLLAGHGFIHKTDKGPLNNSNLVYKSGIDQRSLHFISKPNPWGIDHIIHIEPKGRWSHIGCYNSPISDTQRYWGIGNGFGKESLKDHLEKFAKMAESFKRGALNVILESEDFNAAMEFILSDYARLLEKL